MDSLISDLRGGDQSAQAEAAARLQEMGALAVPAMIECIRSQGRTERRFSEEQRMLREALQALEERERVQNSFQRHVEHAVDLEQFLTHSMDWLLREFGYVNIGIWILDGNNEPSTIGAWMKYTLKATSELLNALKDGTVRLAVRHGSVGTDGAGSSYVSGQTVLTPAEIRELNGHQTFSVVCKYLAEPLAVIQIICDRVFTEKEQQSLKAIEGQFALKLAELAKKNQASEESPGPPKEDPADWWKRGDTPPF